MTSSLHVKCIYPGSFFFEAMLPIYISTFIAILSKLNEISGYLRFVEMKTVIEMCVQFRFFYLIQRIFCCCCFTGYIM